jgi:hypothetical protein
VVGANAPFREIRVIYLLASRELLPLFLVDLLRGKRDRLIVKATLRANPGGELEVVRDGGSLARQMRSVKDRPWEITDGPGGLIVGGRGAGCEALRAASLPLVQKYVAQVTQVSWSKKAPHLIAILWLAGLVTQGGSAADLYADLAAAASAAQTSKS